MKLLLQRLWSLISSKTAWKRIGIIVLTVVALVVGSYLSWRIWDVLNVDQRPLLTTLGELSVATSFATVATFAFYRKWVGIGWVMAICFIVAVSVFLSHAYWQDLRNSEESLSSTIRNLGLITGGIIAGVIAVWRGVVGERQANTAHHQAETARQSSLNERYERGTEMLNSDVLSVRLGGIHVLQRLAEEHPEQYHVQVMKVLCAFVRRPTQEDGEDDEAKSTRTYRLRDDLQDAMTAIGRRSDSRVRLERNSGFQVDLRSANLRRVWLKRANLSGAILDGANLTEATFIGANVSNVKLWLTNLSSALFAEPANGQGESGGDPAKGLTQKSLNDACADSELHLLCYVVDPETKKKLKWRGGPCS